MNISKKAFVFALVLTALLSFTCTYAYQHGLFNYRKQKAVANVFVFAETAEGTYQIGGHNVITDIGEKYLRDILGFDNVTGNNATKWIAVSNDASPDATWTKLAGEKTASGFERALGSVASWMNGTDYAYNVTKKFTSTADAQTLQCAGLQWSGDGDTDNNLFACAAFTQTTFNTNDNCTIKWVITWNAN